MKVWRVALAALSVGTSGIALAAPAERANPAFTGGDLFNLSAASDAQISPDGRQIAYVRRSNDIMTDAARSAIWLVDVATGEQRPLVAGNGNHFSPRWSPDGRRLAYASTSEGGAPQLFVRWIDTGQSVRITGLPDSPIGNRLVARRSSARLCDERARRWPQIGQRSTQARRG